MAGGYFNFHCTVLFNQFICCLFSAENNDRNDEQKKREERTSRSRSRAVKELADLVKDNKGRSPADKVAIWRKIEQALARNDAVVNE